MALEPEAAADAILEQLRLWGYELHPTIDQNGPSEPEKNGAENELASVGPASNGAENELERSRPINNGKGEP